MNKSSFPCKVIDTQTQNTNIRTLYDQIDKETIDLDAKYQRKFVWTRENMKLLIDSIIKGYSINAIHFTVDNKFKYVCLDGKQRLTTIKNFINNDVTWTSDDGIEYYFSKNKDNKKKAQVMSEAQQNEFLNQNVVIIIYKNLTEEEQLEIFKRIQGGRQLTDGERMKAIAKDREVNISNIIAQFKEQFDKLIKKRNKKIVENREDARVMYVRLLYISRNKSISLTTSLVNKEHLSAKYLTDVLQRLSKDEFQTAINVLEANLAKYFEVMLHKNISNKFIKKLACRKDLKAYHFIINNDTISVDELVNVINTGIQKNKNLNSVYKEIIRNKKNLKKSESKNNDNKKSIIEPKVKPKKAIVKEIEDSDNETPVSVETDVSREAPKPAKKKIRKDDDVEHVANGKKKKLPDTNKLNTDAIVDDDGSEEIEGSSRDNSPMLKELPNPAKKKIKKEDDEESMSKIKKNIKLKPSKKVHDD